MEDGSPITGALILLLLLLIKGIVSNAKAAINYVNEGNVKKKAEEGDEKSQLLLELIDMPLAYIYAIDVVITTISVLSGIVYVKYFSIYLSGVSIGKGKVNELAGIALFILGVLAMVVIIALFGSFIPKKLAKKDSERKAYRMVYIMNFISKFLRPLTFCMQSVVALVISMLGINPKELEESVTEEGIISLVNEGHEQGVLEETEVKMISNIIEFDEKNVNDIMTHRRKVVALDNEMTFEDAFKYILNANYSRFPLYEGDLDNIIGIVNFKDMAKAYATMDYKNMSLKDIARKAHFVPDTQNIDVLFNDMKDKKNHMAIVVDEYGQTAGIVAFEDVLEEIVGNIVDEYDVDEKYITRQANGNYLMRGLASLDEVQELLDIQMEAEVEFDTLNGFLVYLLGRIPDEGEKFNVEYKGYQFEVLDVRDNIIRFVRVKKAASK